MRKIILIEDPMIYPGVNKVHNLEELMSQEESTLSIGRRDGKSELKLGGEFPYDDTSTNLGSVSKNHAVLKRDGEKFVIEDVGSKNGTAIMRGKHIFSLEPNTSYVLAFQDQIYFGGEINTSQEGEIDLSKTYGPVIFEEIEEEE